MAKLGLSAPVMSADLPAGGKRLLQRATKSIAAFGAGGTVVASAAVKREAPAYINELNAADRSGAKNSNTLIQWISFL
jgi:hypothetical protein